MTPSSTVTPNLIAELRAIVGHHQVLTGDGPTRRYRMGYRVGGGPAAAVVRPGTLVEQWRVLQACVKAGAIIIMQAANTGLTGGSTPHRDNQDRPVVILSTARLRGIHLLDEGRQVVCLPGATLNQLELRLKPLGREPHSVIGSSCIGASVMGGVCNNSGGSLVKRGPAFTELALYAQLGADGELRLVNHLDIALGDDPEAMLERIERGDFRAEDVTHDSRRCASDHDYQRHVRDIDASTPARFNADPRRLFEASGSAGKLSVFAVRLDTFPAEDASSVFYIGTNDPSDFTHLRRRILSEFASLPVAGEYMHRDAFDMAAKYGKDTYLAIKWLGTERLPRLFALKAWLDGAASAVGWKTGLSDHLLQAAARLFPQYLPHRLTEYRNRFEHHLILRMSGEGVAEARALLAQSSLSWFECEPREASAAFLHRFAAAGAAIRYRNLHQGRIEDLMSLDIALPRNAVDWLEVLPPEIDAKLTHKLYYGHFFCHVLHQDYLVKKGEDPVVIEHALWQLLDARGAEYPAEHNVGHIYPAKPALAAHYQALDPCNRFNPGIGETDLDRP